jgi:glycosyltransferase involved in cell wall biosynthesis
VLDVVPFLEAAAYLDLLRRADVFLLPSAYETFCVVAAEAIGCGVPVVLSDRGGQQDFVGEACGRLVDGDDPAAFADALQDVLATTDRAALLAAAADLRTRFAEPAIAHDFVAVYATVVGTETASGAPT